MNAATGAEGRVCALIAQRQGVGIAKYGGTLEANPAGRVERIRHALQEACDLAAYLQWELDKAIAESTGPHPWGEATREPSP